MPRQEISGGYRIGDNVSLRRRVTRLRRLAARAHQAPLRFVLWKLFTLAVLPIWNSIYWINSATARVWILQHLVTNLSTRQVTVQKSMAALAADLRPEAPSDTAAELEKREQRALDNRIDILGFGE